MGSYKKEYWTKKEDELMLILFNKSTSRLEYNKTYEAVVGKLRYMAKQILNKYYWINDSRVDDLITDAITHLLIKANFDGSRGKVYSYCGTIIKRYFYTTLVIPTTFKEKKDALNVVDDNYEVSNADNEWVIDNHATQPDFDEFDTEERQLMLDKLLLYFQTHIDKLRKNIKKYEKDYSARITIWNREIQWLECCKEYFEKYFMTGNIDSMGLSDYCVNNLDMQQYIQMKIAYKYLGKQSNPRKYDSRVSEIDTKVREYGLSYLMDDYSPKEYSLRIAYRQITKKGKRDFSYF
jgi:hypothetical protein